MAGQTKPILSRLHQTVYFIKKKEKKEEAYHWLEKMISTTNK